MTGSIIRILPRWEPIDPRRSAHHAGRAHLRAEGENASIIEWWKGIVDALVDAGLSGVCARKPSPTSAPILGNLIAGARQRSNRTLQFIADTTGSSWSDWPGLTSCGFDHTFSSLAWWDGRASWLVEEFDALSCLAPPIAVISVPDKLLPLSIEVRRAKLAVAAVAGNGTWLCS